MSDNERPVLHENNAASAKLPAQKEPWQRPTVESLDVADTEAMAGLGGDAGGCSLS